VDEAAAQVAVKHLGWSEERAMSEVEAYRRYVERYKPRSFLEKTVEV
jgi:glycerol-3-phosphate dehydrogenase